jgi:hypothetical protein
MLLTGTGQIQPGLPRDDGNRAGRRYRKVGMGNWQLDPYHTQLESCAKHPELAASGDAS